MKIISIPHPGGLLWHDFLTMARKNWIMPWTTSDYPASMKNLPSEVRHKAIEIGNALLDEGEMKEGIAIATAISRAKDWAANRGKKTGSSTSNSTDVKKHGEDRYVIPYKGTHWAIKKEGSDRVEKVFDRKDDAVKQAREEAKKVNGALTIQKKTGAVQKRVSYNPNKGGR